MQKICDLSCSKSNKYPNFTSNKQERTNSLEKPQQEESCSGKQISGVVMATALSAAVLAGGIIRGKNKSIRALEKSVSGFAEETSGLRRSINSLTSENSELKYANELLEKANSDLREEFARIKSRLDNILKSGFGSGEDDTKIISNLRTKINNTELDYDANRPITTGVKELKKYNKGLDYESTVVGTTNRAYIKEVDIPEITSEGRFDIELPISDEVKITKVDTVEFQPVKNVSTSISESYADSVQWDNDKIARDVLQNFFDGHGQTLDGVRFKFEPLQDGKYRVRIEGKSTYTPDKAVYIGESSKRGDAKAAGNYGEGLKMAALKLLRDKGAESVKIGSDNWKLAYNLECGNLSDKRVLSYSLDKVDKFDGNYVEFETSDKDLLDKLRKTINRFYSSFNSHFKCPDFENETFGIKVLPNPKQKGALYIAGQRFEFNGDYDGLEGVVLFIKEKLPVSVLDPSRDRTSINQSQLINIAGWLSREKTSEQEKMQVIKVLERYMEEKDYNECKAMDKFVSEFIIEACGDYNASIHESVDFPEKFVAYSGESPETIRKLMENGYKICKRDFQYVGMRTITDLIGNAQKHKVLTPTKIQEKKILIIKEALKELAPSLELHFTQSELNPKIYLFDKNAAGESNIYKDCIAEAITDLGVSKGFWIDRGHLDNASFSEVLETALHELSHKVGGDGSRKFTYKLTDVNEQAISQILTNANSRKHLQALNALWEELNLATSL